MVRTEQDRPSPKLPVVDMEEFLSWPFRKPQKATLKEGPTLALLKRLPEIKDEEGLTGIAGLVYKDRVWTIVKAPIILGILAADIPKDADILIHSHPVPRTEEESREIRESFGLEVYPNAIETSTPPVTALYNCLPKGRNFLVSVEGITSYHFPMGQYQRDALFLDPVKSDELGVGMIKESISNLTRERKEYRNFVSQNGGRFRVYPWSEITRENLADLIYGYDLGVSIT